MSGEAVDFRQLIRAIPDFPKAGVMFRDLMPMLASPAAFRQCVMALAEPWLDAGIQQVLAIEARGFLFGGALAQQLGAGLVPLRKAGKLPGALVGVDYELEYGSERLEVQDDVLHPGSRAILLDDVLATGGTLLAARELARALKLELVGASVVIEIAALGGRARWTDSPLHALLSV